MPAARNLTGQVFGRLTVLARQGSVKGCSTWLCACSCGTTKVATGNNLVTGGTASCGCLRTEWKDAFGVARKTHGKSKSGGAYSTWLNMNTRCNNPADPAYKDYGGRGIKVCERWVSYENFLEDMGERPEGMSLERLKNELGYSKDNCKWATRQEQNSNSRRNRYVVYQGEKLTVAEFSRRVGVAAATVSRRLDKGQSPEEIVMSKPELYLQPPK